MAMCKNDDWMSRAFRREGYAYGKAAIRQRDDDWGYGDCLLGLGNGDCPSSGGYEVVCWKHREVNP